MLRDVFVFVAGTSDPYAASHIDHEKRDSLFSISKHACGSAAIVLGFHLTAFRAAETSSLVL